MNEDNQPEIVIHHGMFSQDALGEFDPKDRSIHIIDKDVLYNIVLEHEREHWNHRERKYMRILRLCNGRRFTFWVIAWLLGGYGLVQLTQIYELQLIGLAIATVPMFLLEFEEYIVGRSVYRKFREEPNEVKSFRKRVSEIVDWIKEK